MKKQTNSTTAAVNYNLVVHYLCACCAKKLDDAQQAVRINIKGQKGIVNFILSHIVAVKANGSSADFYVLQPRSEKKLRIITASFPLKKFPLLYLHPGIVRVHDSWMINLRYVYQLCKNGDLNVHYLEDIAITISPTYKPQVFEEMKKLGFVVYE